MVDYLFKKNKHAANAANYLLIDEEKIIIINSPIQKSQIQKSQNTKSQNTYTINLNEPNMFYFKEPFNKQGFFRSHFLKDVENIKIKKETDRNKKNIISCSIKNNNYKLYDTTPDRFKNLELKNFWYLDEPKPKSNIEPTIFVFKIPTFDKYDHDIGSKLKNFSQKLIIDEEKIIILTGGENIDNIIKHILYFEKPFEKPGFFRKHFLADIKIIHIDIQNLKCNLGDINEDKSIILSKIIPDYLKTWSYASPNSTGGKSRKTKK